MLPELSDSEKSNSYNLHREELKEVIRLENTHWNFDKIKYLWITLALLVLNVLLRGGKFTRSIIGIEQCSATYWLILLAFVIYCVIVTVIIIRKLKKENALKEKYGYKFHSSEIHLSTHNCVKLSIIALIGGMAAGGLGIGGGMIFIPILLREGMLPSVASATAMYLVIYSSFSTSS